VDNPVFLKNKSITFFSHLMDLVLFFSLVVYALIAISSFLSFVYLDSNLRPKIVIFFSLSTIVEFFVIFAYGVYSNSNEKKTPL
jgi:hypothetical protein